jgi:hypothetical protein
MANLQDVIERMKAEGDLTRNSGTNSIKQTNRILGEMNLQLVEIGKSLGAIRTVGGLGRSQVVQVTGGGGGTAAPATASVSGGETGGDPQTLMGLLGAAIRNQTLGRVERATEAALDFAAERFRESALGRGLAATQRFVGEKVEGTKEGLRSLAGLQTNAEALELARRSAEEENATRESIDQLVEIQTRFLGLSEDEAQELRRRELERADLGSGGSAAPTATMIGAGATGAAGGGAGGGRSRASGSGGGQMGGMIGKFFGGLAGGALAGFIMALGNAAVLKAAAIFAAVLPLIGVALGGFIAAFGKLASFGLDALGETFPPFVNGLKKFEDLDGQKLSLVGNGLEAFFDGLPGLSGMMVTIPDGLDDLADSLIKMNDVNAEKLKVIGPAVEEMGRGLMAAGLGEVFSSIAGALGSDSGGIEGQMTSLANGFRQFKDINADDVAKIGPAVRDLGLGLKAAADSDGFGNALGGIIKGIGSFFGAEEEDPIEMFKRFAVLGQGEVGSQLEAAGQSLAGLGQGLSALNNLDTDTLGNFADDILPPLTKLTSAFDSEVFKIRGNDPMGSFVGGLAKLKELEGLNGNAIKTNLEGIGGGLDEFADYLDDGEIQTLAEYVKDVAGPILALTGRGGGGSGSAGRAGTYVGGGSGSAGRAGTYVGGEKFMPGKELSENQRAALMARQQMGNELTPDEQISLSLKPGQKYLTKEQYDKIITDPANETNNRLKKLATDNYLQGQGETYSMRAERRLHEYIGQFDFEPTPRVNPGGGRTNGVAINGASREIAAGQRQSGGNVIAPTDNSNNSTNVTNVNNGGSGGPPPSPRRSQHRGGMYDRMG